jgi:hypothetical protein
VLGLALIRRGTGTINTFILVKVSKDYCVNDPLMNFAIDEFVQMAMGDHRTLWDGGNIRT